MLNFLLISILVGLITAFVIITSEKTGLIVYLASKTKSRELNMLLSCYFCLSFWLAVIISFFISLFIGNFWYLFICIPSSVISRKLI